MRDLKQLLIPALAVAALAAAPAATAATTGTALGNEGELYRLTLGTYGELVGDTTAPEASYPVLGLRIEHAEGASELALVPESIGPEVENTPFLLYESASRTVFLAWEERINHIHSRIRLVSYRDGAWSEVVNVSEGAFDFKGAPRLAATRDSFRVQNEDGTSRNVARTVLHVVWVEERSEGQRVVYAPVTLLDGEEIGSRTIVDLSAMLPAAEPGTLTDLWRAAPPTVDVAEDDHSVIVGLVDPRHGNLASLRATMLPGELSMLADALRSHLIDVGISHEWQSPEGLRRLADALRSHLIDVGHRLDPQILRHVADGLRSHLIDVGVQYTPSDLSRMARDLRSHLIDVGFRLDDRGLRRVTSGLSARVIEVAAVPGVEAETLPTMSQIAQVAVVDGWSRPVEATQASVLMVSRNGQEALVSWTDGSSVFYRETFGGEWSTTHRLPVGKGLDAEEALVILQNRIRNR